MAMDECACGPEDAVGALRVRDLPPGFQPQWRNPKDPEGAQQLLGFMAGLLMDEDEAPGLYLRLSWLEKALRHAHGVSSRGGSDPASEMSLLALCRVAIMAMAGRTRDTCLGSCRTEREDARVVQQHGVLVETGRHVLASVPTPHLATALAMAVYDDSMPAVQVLLKMCVASGTRLDGAVATPVSHVPLSPLALAVLLRRTEMLVLFVLDHYTAMDLHAPFVLDVTSASRPCTVRHATSTDPRMCLVTPSQLCAAWPEVQELPWLRAALAPRAPIAMPV